MRDKKTEHKESTVFDLKEFGIDENTINLVKSMIPTLISDIFIKKSANFALEQKNLNESINNNTREKIEILNQNIFSFRSVLLTITGFSLTILGVVLSSLMSGKNIFNNQNILYLGLICFVFSTIISILFILNIYHFENNKLHEQIKFNKSYYKDINKILKNNLINKNFDDYLVEKQNFLEEKIKEEEIINNKKNKYGFIFKNKDKDYTPHVAIFLFLFGFILILISFI